MPVMPHPPQTEAPAMPTPIPDFDTLYSFPKES
jgi:hypothetical protein